MRVLLMMAAGWLLALPLAAREDPEGRLPERPQGQVHDPARLFSGGEAEVLDKRLAGLRESDRIDIMVAVLPSAPPVRPDVYASQLLDRWGEGDAQVLILHVVGDKEGPWLAGGGRMLRLVGEQACREALLEARKRIGLGGGDRNRVMVAVDEMEDLLRFLSYRGLYQEERLRTLRVSYQLAEMRRDLRQRIVFISAGAAGLVLAVALLGLGVYWKRYRAPQWFPATSWRLRFGAPYAGGNDAVIRLDHQSERRNSLAPEQSPDG